MAPSELHVTLLLADAAQVADGRLYVLGGGLVAIGPDPQPMAVAIALRVPPQGIGVLALWRLELLDAAGGPVEAGGRPVAVSGRFEAVRPAGHLGDTPVVVPLAVSFAGLPVRAGAYCWQLQIDGVTDPAWQAPFSVRT
jgi:hypothetical protein